MKITQINPYDNSIIDIQHKYHLDYFSMQNEPEEIFEKYAPIQWQNLVATNEDRSFPKDVFFEWEISGSLFINVDFEVIISETNNLKPPIYIKKTNETKIICNNFLLNQQYFWQVIAKSNDKIVAKSQILSFKTSNIPPRWIKVPDITNVRDIGGWKTTDGKTVKQGLLFRSSELNNNVNLTEEGRRILLEDLKIKTDIDLRGFEEKIMPVLDENKVKWLNFSIAPYINVSQPEYQPPYREVFRIFADKSYYPLIFHCVGGADRTGTVTFLLNGLLSVNLNDLCLDYELTSFSIWGGRTSKFEDFCKMVDYFNTFGDENDSLKDKIEKYLLHIGVTKEEIKSIRTNLIE